MACAHYDECFCVTVSKQGALKDCDEALSWEKRTAVALRCRGATKTMLSNLQARVSTVQMWHRGLFEILAIKTGITIILRLKRA